MFIAPRHFIGQAVLLAVALLAYGVWVVVSEGELE